MYKMLIAAISAITIMNVGVQATEPSAKVSKIGDGDFVTIEISDKGNRFWKNTHVFDINDEDGVIHIGEEIPISKIRGKFYTSLDVLNEYGDKERLYQFRSEDNSVFWLLSRTEICHIPNNSDEYVLYFSDNGTNADDKICDCLPEWECECEVYDDIFLGICKTR